MASQAIPQTDDFEQYKRPPQAAEGDEFAQYKRPAVPEQEGAGTRFLRSAGLPANKEEFGDLPPRLEGMTTGDPRDIRFEPGSFLRGAAAPKPSTKPGAEQSFLHEQQWPIVGGMFRDAAETRAEPGIWSKIYGNIPVVGPTGYRMGKQLESGDYAGAAGSGLNIATQFAGLRGEAAPIAEAAHDVAAPVVRGTVKGINRTLEHAPGTVGAGLGAGLAHEAGLPPWIGAGAGYGLGRELLPKLKLPGEKFGTGPRAPNQTFFTKNQDPFLRSPGIEGEAPPVESAPFANKDFVGQRPNIVPTPMVGTQPATQIYRSGKPRLLPAAPEPPINPGKGEIIPPAPYRLKGSQLTQPATVTPRQVIPPSRQLTTTAGEAPARAPRPSNWPPAAARNVIQETLGVTPKAELADRLETRSMQEAMREDLEKHGQAAYSQEKRDWFARNQPGTSKADLVAQAKARFAQTPPVEQKPVVGERGTFAADPRTHEQILQAAKENLGGGQGKVAMQEGMSDKPATAAPATRPGFGTAKVPIEELTGEDLIKALKAMADKKKK